MKFICVPLYGCYNICILYCGCGGRGLVLKWVGHTAGGRSLILIMLYYEAFKRARICPWIEFLNDVSHPNCEAQHRLTSYVRFLLNDVLQFLTVSNCVWFLHGIQKCCYTSRTRDAGAHTHTHTERVPAAWQHIQLFEIWAEIHEEEAEQATGKRKQYSEVGGLKAVNIMVQGHTSTNTCLHSPNSLWLWPKSCPCWSAWILATGDLWKSWKFAEQAGRQSER